MAVVQTGAERGRRRNRVSKTGGRFYVSERGRGVGSRPAALNVAPAPAAGSAGPGPLHRRPGGLRGAERTAAASAQVLDPRKQVTSPSPALTSRLSIFVRLPCFRGPSQLVLDLTRPFSGSSVRESCPPTPAI